MKKDDNFKPFFENDDLSTTPLHTNSGFPSIRKVEMAPVSDEVMKEFKISKKRCPKLFEFSKILKSFHISTKISHTIFNSFSKMHSFIITFRYKRMLIGSECVLFDSDIDEKDIKRIVGYEIIPHLKSINSGLNFGKYVPILKRPGDKITNDLASRFDLL